MDSDLLGFRPSGCNVLVIDLTVLNPVVSVLLILKFLVHESPGFWICRLHFFLGFICLGCRSQSDLQPGSDFLVSDRPIGNILVWNLPVWTLLGLDLLIVNSGCRCQRVKSTGFRSAGLNFLVFTPGENVLDVNLLVLFLLVSNVQISRSPRFRCPGYEWILDFKWINSLVLDLVGKTPCFLWLRCPSFRLKTSRFEQS